MITYNHDLVKDIGLNNLSESQILKGVEALNGFAELTGLDWIQFRKTKGSRSPFYIHEVIQIWDDWCVLRHLPKADIFSKRLKFDYDSTTSEIYVGAKLVTGGFEIEIEPLLEGRKPDFRFNIEKEWIYLETCYRSLSKSLINANKILEEASSLVAKSIPGRHGMLALLKPITLEELPTIKKWLDKNASKHEAYLDSVAYYYSDAKIDSCIDDNHALTKYLSKPRLFATYFTSDLRGPGTKGTACMQVCDFQAQEILENEAKQLSKNELGIICLDLSRVMGGIREWAPLIEKRFQPKINTRISAVILIEKVMSIHGEMHLLGTFLNNKFSNKPIPERTVSRLKTIFHCQPV